MKTVISNCLFILLSFSGFFAGAQHFTNYTTTEGLPSNNVNGVAVDANNVKWFGTQDGVARFNDTVWTTYTTANGLIDNYINCIAVDVDNHIWVGTDVGVSKFDGSHWTSYTTENGLVSSVVNYIAGDPDGSVWIGTGSGLSHFDGTTWKNYTTAEGLPGDMISYIACEQSGDTWIGTWIGGLSKFDGSTFTNFTTADSLPDNNILAIGLGTDGTKWFGTYYGVAVFNNLDKWTVTYRKTDGLFNNFIQDIDMDSKGTMWFANYDIYTQDAGITKKTTTEWKTFTTADGLINAPLRRLAVDKSDNIWVATSMGVSKLTDAHAGLGEMNSLPVNIYPNPATQEIHLDGLSSSGILDIRSVEGKTFVRQGISKGNNTVNLGHTDSGLYIVRLTTENGVYTGKLIVR